MGTAPPAGTTGLTYRDLLDLPSEGGTRFELLDGELLVTRRPRRAIRTASCISVPRCWRTRVDMAVGSPLPRSTSGSPTRRSSSEVVALATQHTGQVGSERIVGPPRVVLEDGGVRSSVLADFVMPAEEVLARIP